MAPPKRDAEYLEYITAKSPWLRRVAYLLCQDTHRADDLVQTTITNLYVHWPKVAKAQQPDAYARAALVNVYLAEQRSSWWKRVTPHREPHEALTAPQGPQASDPDPDPDLRLDLRAALAAIPPRQRTVLILRFYCDLSVKETAELMSCSVGNVKSQTSHGLANLRKHLDIRTPARLEEKIP